MKLPARCVDLTPTQVVLALRSTAAMRHLLEHLARVARPGEGAPKILVPIARMASTDCDWVDGGLTVEITGAADMTQILVAIDLGAGVRELLFPRLVLGVHHDEFLHAIKVAPQLVFPMTSRVKKQGLILTCDGDVVGTIAPPSFELAEESLRRSLPAKLRLSLAPIPERRDTDVDSASLKIDMPIIGEVAILARLVPRAPKTPAIDELAALDVGWDVGSYSSALNTRETKPPPEARPLSTSPTRPPPEPTRSVKAAPRSSKAPPRSSKAPPRSEKTAARAKTEAPTRSEKTAPRAKTERPGPRTPPRPTPKAPAAPGATPPPRNSKAPPPSENASRNSKAPPRSQKVPGHSKAPPRNSKAPPRNSKAPPRNSKAPPRNSKAPAPPRNSKAPPRTSKPPTGGTKMPPPATPRPRRVVRRSPSPAASVDAKT